MPRFHPGTTIQTSRATPITALRSAERNAVIGVALDVWMVVPGWKRGISKPAETPNANLHGLANHVDHMCQLLSTNAHTGIGTDLDGGFGTEQTPADLDTIADLNRFQSILQDRGYDETALSAESAVSSYPRSCSML